MRSSNPMIRLWPVAVAMALFTACVDYICNDYSEYRRVPPEGWRYADSVKLTPLHDDSLCRGRFVVGVTHNDSYRFTELCMEVTYADTAAMRRDTVRMEVVDRFGTWRGRGIGSAFQLTDTLAPVVHPSGSVVSVRQIMREDTLGGINKVGLFFVPDEK